MSEILPVVSAHLATFPSGILTFFFSLTFCKFSDGGLISKVSKSVLKFGIAALCLADRLIYLLTATIQDTQKYVPRGELKNLQGT